MAIDVGKRATGEIKVRSGSSQRQKRISNKGKPVRLKEMLFFLSQISMMLEVGSSLTESLTIIGKQTKNKDFADVIQGMRTHVEGGSQLSEAMSNYPRTFKPVVTNMIRAGESGAFLSDIIDRIIEMQEKQQALISQIKTAITYPALLFILGAIVIVFVLTSVLPKFTVFFDGKEEILPATTRLMMDLSAFLKVYWGHSLIGLFLCIVLFRFLMKTEKAKGLFERFIVTAPLLSAISNKAYTCHMLRTLGHLMKSNVPIVEALTITKDTCGNRYYQMFIDRIRKKVEEGGSFWESFSQNPYILDSIKQMITIGEETGMLPVVMLRIAAFYDNEVEQDLKSASSLIEPLALIFMGGIVGLIVSSVILPMFRLASAIH